MAYRDRFTQRADDIRNASSFDDAGNPKSAYAVQAPAPDVIIHPSTARLPYASLQAIQSHLAHAAMRYAHGSEMRRILTQKVTEIRAAMHAKGEQS